MHRRMIIVDLNPWAAMDEHESGAPQVKVGITSDAASPAQALGGDVEMVSEAGGCADEGVSRLEREQVPVVVGEMSPWADMEDLACGLGVVESSATAHGCSEAEVCSARADLDCSDRGGSRGYGFVPMERREFAECEARLRCEGVLVDSPGEYLDGLSDEVFWSGLSWHSVAKFVRVQVQLWLEDGWAVPARLCLHGVQVCFSETDVSHSLARLARPSSLGFACAFVLLWCSCILFRA